jgi:hypothetical protein
MILDQERSNASQLEQATGSQLTDAAEILISRKSRFYIIVAALLALFMGALDALVMSAAMPTIIADLGGLHLYSWVYSAYFLARAVSLHFQFQTIVYHQHRHFSTGFDFCRPGTKYGPAHRVACVPGDRRRRYLRPGVYCTG